MTQIESKTGATFSYAFRFSQAEVIKFAEVTGDNNPLHLDPEYASTTRFKRPIMHGMLGASVFTKVLGTQFPGFGSIYLSQTLEFLRPMFVDTDYAVKFTILNINSERHVAEIKGEITDLETGKITMQGVAAMMNNEKF